MMNGKIKIKNLINELNKIDDYGVNRSLMQLKKEIKIYLNCINEIVDLENKIKVQLSKKNKVQIGGGSHYLNGFINIDVVKPADIIFDVRKNIPLPSQSINYIFTEHFLEHIDYPVSVFNFFSEANRVLFKQGRLVVGVPDSGLVIKAYINKNKKFLKKIKNNWYSKRIIIKYIDTGIDIVNLLIRDEDCDAKYNPHFWGYDEVKLKKMFKDNGFKNIKKWIVDSSIASPKRKFCTLYIEGTKS